MPLNTNYFRGLGGSGGSAELSAGLEALDDSITLGGQADTTALTAGNITSDGFGFVDLRGGVAAAGIHERGSLSADNSNLISLVSIAHTFYIEVVGDRLSTTSGLTIGTDEYDLYFIGTRASASVRNLTVHQYNVLTDFRLLGDTTYNIKIKKEDGTYLQWGDLLISLGADVIVSSASDTDGLNTGQVQALINVEGTLRANADAVLTASVSSKQDELSAGTNITIDGNDVISSVVPIATTASPGLIQIATDAESQAATNRNKAVTPAGVADIISDRGLSSEERNHITANTAKRSYPAEDETKLSGIEVGATADQTGSDIISLIEGESGNSQLDAAHIRNLPANTNDYVDSLSVAGTTLRLGRTGSLADLTATLPTSGGSVLDGLTQEQVDARVTAGVLDFAETGNTDVVPMNKLPNATESAKGISEFATAAEIDSGVTGGKVVIASQLKRRFDTLNNTRALGDANLGTEISAEETRRAEGDATLNTLIATKQNTLTAGTNITITGDTIAAGGSDTAAEILTKLKTVDGVGSGLNADTVDGIGAELLYRTGSSVTSLGFTPPPGVYYYGANSIQAPTIHDGVVFVTASGNDQVQIAFPVSGELWIRHREASSVPYSAWRDASGLTEAEVNALIAAGVNLESIDTGLSQNLRHLESNITLTGDSNVTTLTPADVGDDRNGFVKERAGTLDIGVIEAGTLSHDNTSLVGIFTTVTLNNSSQYYTRIEVKEKLATTDGIVLDGVNFDLDYVGYVHSEFFVGDYNHLYDVLNRTATLVIGTDITIQFRTPSGGLWHWGLLDQIQFSENVLLAGTVGSGLSESEVDARIVDWAETDDTSLIPVNKLNLATTSDSHSSSNNSKVMTPAKTYDAIGFTIPDWARTNDADIIPFVKLPAANEAIGIHGTATELFMTPAVTKAAILSNLSDAEDIIDLLQAETGDDRLDASAIKNLPANTGTGAAAGVPVSWMKRTSTSTQTLTSSFLNVPFQTLKIDQSQSDITYSDGKFTAVVAGDYRFGAYITIQDLTSSMRAQSELKIYVDDIAESPTYSLGYIRNFTEGVNKNTVIIPPQPFSLTAGQTIELRIKTPLETTTTTISGVNSEIWFERMAGGGEMSRTRYVTDGVEWVADEEQTYAHGLSGTPTNFWGQIICKTAIASEGNPIHTPALAVGDTWQFSISSSQVIEGGYGISCYATSTHVAYSAENRAILQKAGMEVIVNTTATRLKFNIKLYAEI